MYVIWNSSNGIFIFFSKLRYLAATAEAFSSIITKLNALHGLWTQPHSAVQWQTA